MAIPVAQKAPAHRFVLVSAVVLVMGAIVWHAFFRHQPIANVPPRNSVIVAFGDSLTAGTGATPGKDYPSQLAQLLKHPVVNRGIPGDTTSDARARLERDVLTLQPGIVIVILGGNDYLRHVDSQIVERNLSEIIERLQNDGAVVVLGEIRGVLPTGDYGNLYRRLAKRYRTGFVPDLLNDILTRPSRKSDPIHPNDEGYRVIAERVARVVEPLLNQIVTDRTETSSGR